MLPSASWYESPHISCTMRHRAALFLYSLDYITYVSVWLVHTLLYLCINCLINHTPYSQSTKCADGKHATVVIMCTMFVCFTLFHSRRVFISNLQKEIEKQTGYRSSRKRRSEAQYDYEVYHSLEEVDMKPNIYLPISHSPLLSNLLHPQGKQKTSLRVLSLNYTVPHVSFPRPRAFTHRDVRSTSDTSQL